MVEGKIKAKDLNYDKSLPPFLQRLHAQKGGHGDADRHERAIARPKKARDENEDDGPTMIDETGETLSKDEYEKLTAAAVVEESSGVGALEAEARPGETEPSSAKADVKVTDGVASKKRKAVKVIGETDEPAAEDGPTAPKTARKPKKKAKAVKLAFNDDDEET